MFSLLGSLYNLLGLIGVMGLARKLESIVQRSEYYYTWRRVDDDCFSSTSVFFVYLIPFLMWWLCRRCFLSAIGRSDRSTNDLRTAGNQFRTPEAPFRDKPWTISIVGTLNLKRVVWVKSRIVPDGVWMKLGVI